MKKKLLVLCAVMIMCVCRVSAQDGWYVVADDKYYIAVDEVAYMLFTDESEEFSIVKVDGVVIAPVLVATFSESAPESVEGVKNDIDVSVFPNPVVSQLNLQGLRENATAQVYSLDGALLIETALTPANGRIDVSALPAGVYVLQVNQTVVKFVKK